MDAKQIEEVRQKVKVPPNMQPALEKIEMAGKKVMYSKETHQLVMQAIQGPGPLDARLGKAIADLMAILYQQSNKTMPPQLILPAAVLLFCDALLFLMQANQIDDQFDVGAALETAVTMTLQKFGIKPDQVQPMIEKFTKGGMINSAGVANAAGPAPGMAPQQPAPQQPQGV